MPLKRPPQKLSIAPLWFTAEPGAPRVSTPFTERLATATLANKRTALAAPVILLLLAFAIPNALMGADCTGCHTDQAAKLPKSAHAALTCDTCHTDHEKVPHAANLPKPECAAFHVDQSAEFQKSVHAEEQKKGNSAAPDCAFCHGSAHELLKPNTDAFRKALPDMCGTCHSDVADQF